MLRNSTKEHEFYISFTKTENNRAGDEKMRKGNNILRRFNEKF